MTLDLTKPITNPAGQPMLLEQGKPLTLAAALSQALFAARKVSDPVKAHVFSIDLHKTGKLENVDKSDIRLINSVLDSCEILGAGVIGQIKIVIEATSNQ